MALKAKFCVGSITYWLNDIATLPSRSVRKFVEYMAYVTSEP